uniref:Uncharacterized protein n=1 Tax=Anguilla anguilla TaxID=7936 RepID=A0A0E9RJT7_ANGAN
MIFACRLLIKMLGETQLIMKINVNSMMLRAW